MSTANLALMQGTALSLGDNEQLERIAQDIERLQTTAILHIAAQAAKAHELFRYKRDEGGYTGWMKDRLGHSRSSAYRLLDVHRRFGGGESVPMLGTLSPSALYLLAAPATPQEAVDQVAARIKAGEKPSCAMVAEAIAKAKGVADPTPVTPDDPRQIEQAEAAASIPIAPATTKTAPVEREQTVPTGTVVLRDWRSGQEYVEANQDVDHARHARALDDANRAHDHVDRLHAEADPVDLACRAGVLDGARRAHDHVDHDHHHGDDQHHDVDRSGPERAPAPTGAEQPPEGATSAPTARNDDDASRAKPVAPTVPEPEKMSGAMIAVALNPLSRKEVDHFLAEISSAKQRLFRQHFENLNAEAAKLAGESLALLTHPRHNADDVRRRLQRIINIIDPDKARTTKAVTGGANPNRLFH